jgi:phage-related protein
LKKALIWIESCKKDLGELPSEVEDFVGHNLWLVQEGGTPSAAKVLSNYGGAGVLELIDNFDGDTYRAVYTVRFEEAVYVLHCFMKKSTSGISTPKRDLATIKRRPKKAEERHKEWQAKQPKKKKSK